jgi:lipoyl(octanoyl) transferase
MTSRFLGRIPFTQALAFEQDAFTTVLSAGLSGVILGFESDPVITRGVRASDADLILNRDAITARGFEICTVDRGGQATIHNPGQLVIFPIVNIRAVGARAWVESLAQVSRECLATFGIQSEWRESDPGLYTAKGKIMACGVRIRRGISTHGVSINVHNVLADFALIRACGVTNAPLDRMGEPFELQEVFNVWCAKFHEAHG